MSKYSKDELIEMATIAIRAKHGPEAGPYLYQRLLARLSLESGLSTTSCEVHLLSIRLGVMP